jgi:beta-1,4-mannosyl-glycoprotein beta-1,4-N-acetylglucosaminyltransferase
MLELRLKELWDTVDYFVISEANLTHQNNPKPFYLKDNWDRFEKYSEKIRHVLIEDMPGHADTWINERHQRRELRRGLTDLQPDDIVIVSDCDEIPRASMIEAIRNDENDYDRYILGIPLFYFKLNYVMTAPLTRQRNISVARGCAFKDPQEMREFTFHKDHAPIVDLANNSVMVDHGGWHFTYFGDDEFAANKLRNFAHAESRHVADTVNIKYMIDNKLGFTGHASPERFDYVIVDDYFPKAITENLEYYKDMIIPGATASIYDYYPEE